MLRLNADSQPRELVGANCSDNRLQPVVTARRTPRSNANFSKRQRQVVGYNNQRVPRFGQLVLSKQTSHSFSAEIHVGLRFHQLDATILNTAARDQRLTLPTLFSNPGVRAALVNQHEPECR